MTTAEIMSQRMPRIDSLTGMRWWAAFFVFTYHMLVFAPLPGLVAAVLNFGHFGVTFFFVLSGFVLTWSASSKVSQSTFYWRRFARVWPSHFVALLLAIPVFHALDPSPEEWWVKPLSIGILALSVVLLQGWSTTDSVLFSGNPAAWTLTCEAFFYALHPYISKILGPLRTRGALVFALVTISLAFVYRAIAVAWPELWISDLPLPITRLNEFAIGMAIAWAFRSGWRPRIPVSVGVASIVVFLLAIAFVPTLLPGSAPGWVLTHFSNELFTVACAVTIAALAAGTLAGRASFFATPVMVRLGEWSFAFYLVHATFIYIALAWLGQREPGWFNLLWYAALLTVGIIGAALLHHFVEKPVERRLRAWKDARSARAVEVRVPQA